MTEVSFLSYPHKPNVNISNAKLCRFWDISGKIPLQGFVPLLVAVRNFRD